MNAAHWHLLLNHLPISGVVIGGLLLATGFILKNNAVVKRTAMGVFVFAALCAIPAFLTGEGAEEIAERLPGVSDSVIEEHEDLGKVFLILTSVLGLLAILATAADILNARVTAAAYGLVFMVSLAAMVFAKQAGTSGGEIRHTEIRSNAAATGADAADTGEHSEDTD